MRLFYYLCPATYVLHSPVRVVNYAMRVDIIRFGGLPHVVMSSLQLLYWQGPFEILLFDEAYILPYFQEASLASKIYSAWSIYHPT
jgi:late competence protein required for DNA uptake (superfamily II DNA/RNA helicase)